MGLTAERRQALDLSLKLYEAMPKVGQPKVLDAAKEIVEAAKEIETFIASAPL